MNSRRTIPALLASAALAATAFVGTAVAGQSSATTANASSALCHYTWGSLPKAAATMVAGPMTDIRAGRHTCFDRVVVDLRGSAPGYRVRYVDRLVQSGSGTVVPVRGGAKIAITVNAPSYDENGQAVYQPENPAEAVDVTGYATLRQVRWMKSYEGYSDIGMGVRARLPFRVFTLSGSGSSRLVIDVAHNW